MTSRLSSSSEKVTTQQRHSKLRAKRRAAPADGSRAAGLARDPGSSEEPGRARPGPRREHGEPAGLAARAAPRAWRSFTQAARGRRGRAPEPRSRPRSCLLRKEPGRRSGRSPAGPRAEARWAPAAAPTSRHRRAAREPAASPALIAPVGSASCSRRLEMTPRHGATSSERVPSLGRHGATPRRGGRCGGRAGRRAERSGRCHEHGR